MARLGVIVLILLCLVTVQAVMPWMHPIPHPFPTFPTSPYHPMSPYHPANPVQNKMFMSNYHPFHPLSPFHAISPYHGPMNYNPRLFQYRGIQNDRAQCRLIPRSSPRNQMAFIEVAIPMDCMNGIVEWHYPQSPLYLHTTRMSGYNLCLEEAWNTYLGGIRVVTGGMNRPLPPPSRERPVCVSDVYGRVELLISPHPLSYLVVSFRYKTIPSFIP